MPYRGVINLMVGRMPLRIAVLSAVAVALAVPLILAGWLEHRASETDGLDDLRRDAVVMVESLAIGLRGPMRGQGAEFMHAIAQSSLRDPRVVSVTVSRPDGSNVLDIYRSVNASASRISEKRPVHAEGKDLGTVQVVVTTGPLYEALTLQRNAMVMRLVVGALLALAAVLWLLDRLVLRPVLVAVGHAQHLSDRELDAPIVSERTDELGQLSQALETTRCALKEAFQQLEQRNRELKAYAETLEARVEQRTQDFSESNERLTRSLAHLKSAQTSLLESEKLASLGRLVGGIAHDLNTPLGNSMTVVTDLVERHDDFRQRLSGGAIRKSELDQFLEHSRIGLGILHRNAERAATLIGHFKQVAIDQSTERRRTFGLAEVVEETLSTLQHRFKRSPYVLHAELSDQVQMDSYPGPLEQVIIHLVSNALHHAFRERNHGTVTVRIDRINRQRARLVVRDDGLGMSNAQMEHLYEPFFSTSESARDDRTGGLGLNIVYSIVTGVLGGKIDIQSSPETGTACIIDLPVEAPKYQPPTD